MTDYPIENKLSEFINDLVDNGYEVRKADGWENCLEINKGLLFKGGAHIRLKNRGKIQLKRDGIFLQIEDLESVKDVSDRLERQELANIVRHYVLF